MIPISYESRVSESNRAVVTVATGDYNQYIPTLHKSAREHFSAHVYLFTDKPSEYSDLPDITVIEIPHLGWPRMPLLRFELLHLCRDVFKEQYLFLLDAEAEFVRHINQSVLDHRVATLHRNIMRFRDEFNYEKRRESLAFVEPTEGEKYYACGFVGGARREFLRMAEVISDNIRADIANGIRARWGDESHLNRYLIDNRPTTVLPPNFMCPQGNAYFVPYIVHRHKDFKSINKPDTDRFLTVEPADYENVWENYL